MIFLQILSGLVGLVNFVAALIVLIRLFQREGALKGILGLICMIYTFIWGWTKFNDQQLNIRTWMIVWTIALVFNIILGAITGIIAASQQNSGMILPWLFM